VKKKWITIVGIVVLVGIFATVAFADNPIKLIVNGQEIKPDVPPQIINGRVMVPVRWVAEALGANVWWDEQNMAVVVSYSKEVTTESNIGLISQYLRKADTPKQFVENFAHALQNRNGAVARLFLTPEIREQIKPEVIGPSTPIKKFEINESTVSNNIYSYNIKAYYGPYGNWPPMLAFEMNLTVEPEKYHDGSPIPGRYFITKLAWVKQ